MPTHLLAIVERHAGGIEGIEAKPHGSYEIRVSPTKEVPFLADLARHQISFSASDHRIANPAKMAGADLASMADEEVIILKETGASPRVAPGRVIISDVVQD